MGLLASLIAFVAAPDGTQFWVYEDGSYARECWDGSLVSDSDTGSTTPAEVNCPTCGATGAKRLVSTFASFGFSSSSGSGSSASCAPSGGG